MRPSTITVIKNIHVGVSPEFIESFGDYLYVANYFSNTISVIDPSTNEVVAGVTFDTIPFRGGQIICNGMDAPINRYFYVSSGTECVAKPNSGYDFASWIETFDDNSTRTINASTPADSPLAALRDVFSDNPTTDLTRTVSAPASSDSPIAFVALHDAFTDDPAATLTVNRFGNFTAYFRALPTPIPAEFTLSLITVIVAALVGSLLIPAAVSWFKSKKQTSRLNSFHLDMASINKDGLDERDISNLNKLNQNVSDSYSAGKITNEQYTNLKNEVSIAFQEIFKKRIESLIEQDLEAINKTRNDIMDAYNNGKLSNEHYTNLKNEISNAYQKIFKKRIESITDPDTKAVNKLKNDIEDAYSNRKITELDYNLLNAKISRMLDKK